MLDIKWMRQHADETKELLSARGVDQGSIDYLLDLDDRRRQMIQESEELKQERNIVSKEIAEKKRQKEEATDAIKAMQAVATKIKAIDSGLEEVEQAIFDLASGLPNIPHETVPIGKDEDDNVEVRRWGNEFLDRIDPKEAKPHWDLGENLDIFDFERGAKVAHRRFLYYKGLGARLERAVYNFMLDVHTIEHGYQEMITPYLVNNEAMYGTGQFPKFKEDVFQIDHEQLTLIPTAEVPLTNYRSQEILDEDELPAYFTAMSPCFRSEAGSAGRDTRGIIRLHQFHKVELVKLAHPDHSYAELDKMVADAESILQKLELPYRTIILCTGDMGFSAAKTYDIEVWMPAQNTYREISSCSNTEDFQARRAMIRYRDRNGKIHFVHTLNGSGLAVGRTVAAIIENYQQVDGSIKIPEVLVSYMGGKTEIRL